MTVEEAEKIQGRIEKNAKEILKYLVETTENKSNKNFILGKTGEEIKDKTKLSSEEINAAAEYMEVKNWAKSIHHQYKFRQVEITNKGREVYKGWNAEKK